MLNESLVSTLMVASFFVMGFVVRASFEQWVINKLEKELDCYKRPKNGHDDSAHNPLPLIEIKDNKPSS